MRASSTGGNAITPGTNLAQMTDTLYLPSGIVLGNSADMSPLLASGSVTPQVDSERIIKRASTARYKAFQINADGSTNMEQLMGGGFHPNLAYFTLGEENALEGSQSIPKNFFAVQVDPATARTSTYRP